MFLDETVILVRAGNGGAGCVAFLREPRKPWGGPAGGDGGDGGDVVLAASPHRSTLADLERRPEYRAGNGAPGGGRNRHGRDGQDLILEVPAGTLVFDAQRGNLLKDLDAPGQRAIVARGGKGGRGNQHFATPTRRTPREAEDGEEGEARRLRLELRLLASVGLVGLPNAGKSTLLAALSHARPRIAAYPFTTKTPKIGMVEVEPWRRILFADIPGLLEGAHRGRGLGDRFLRHVSRTRLLLHLVDLSGAEGAAESAFRVVHAELEAYGEGAAGKPTLVLGTKTDLLEPREARRRARGLAAASGSPVVLVSALRRQGLDDLLRRVAHALPENEGGPCEGTGGRPGGTKVQPEGMGGQGEGRTGDPEPSKKAARTGGGGTAPARPRRREP